MGRQYLYNVVDTDTSRIELTQKTTDEIAEHLGCTKDNVNQAVMFNRKIQDHYTVIAIKSEPMDKKNTLPSELLEEWDRVTAGFKRLYRIRRQQQYESSI